MDFKNNSFSYIVLTAIIFLIGMSYGNYSTKVFDEITVERINIVEPDGTIRLVLSNKDRQHPGRMDGEDLPPRERQAGMLFFNDEGDEAGGLIFGLHQAGDQKVSFLSLTMDQYKNDQVVQILNQELINGDTINSTRGLMVNQFPKGSRLTTMMQEIEAAQKLDDQAQMQQRMAEIQQEMGSRPVTFLGKGNDGNGLFIYDNNGVPKLLIFVDHDGNPRLQTMDENYDLVDLISD